MIRIPEANPQRKSFPMPHEKGQTGPVGSSDSSAIPHVIDGGCRTLQGLADRCSCFESIHGPGKISNHADGFLYESEEGYRILVTLLPNDQAEPPGGLASRKE